MGQISMAVGPMAAKRLPSFDICTRRPLALSVFSGVG